MLMAGYWRQPEETAEVIKDGWLYTGDIGYQDEDGYFFITERKKDIIIKGGENIAPREIEEVIYAHPKVSEAAVIGVEDDVYGEEIKALVVLKPGEIVGEKELVAHCVARLKTFKSPKTVVFLENFKKRVEKNGMPQRWMKRRVAMEPVIGHLKREHCMDRNRLKGIEGDPYTVFAFRKEMGYLLRDRFGNVEDSGCG